MEEVLLFFTENADILANVSGAKHCISSALENCVAFLTETLRFDAQAFKCVYTHSTRVSLGKQTFFAVFLKGLECEWKC